MSLVVTALSSSNVLFAGFIRSVSVSFMQRYSCWLVAQTSSACRSNGVLDPKRVEVFDLQGITLDVRKVSFPSKHKDNVSLSLSLSVSVSLSPSLPDIVMI